MMDREWKAGGRAFRRPGLALECALCNWICKGIVQGDKHYLFTRNVSCRVVREAGTLRVVGLLRVGVFPAVAPACVDVENVAGQETAVLETLGLQHRFEVLGGNQLPGVHGLTAAALKSPTCLSSAPGRSACRARGIWRGAEPARACWSSTRANSRAAPPVATALGSECNGDS